MKLEKFTPPVMDPREIEAASFAAIERELGDIPLEPRYAPIVKRVIHATADFDYARSLVFTGEVLQAFERAVRQGGTIVTDTNMARSGISARALSLWGAKAVCLMADPKVAGIARERGVTRAVVSMEEAARLKGPLIFAVGNAPTALYSLCRLMAREELFPAAVIGVPVGFVNVVESKELLLESGCPSIVARGRKGGSGVAAAICNAILYEMEKRK